MQGSKGLSLIETIVVLAIASLVIATAVPAAMAWTDRVRIARLQSDLAETFLTANRLAVASGAATILCPSRGGGCEEGIDWSRGWLVYADVDGDRVFGKHDNVIRRTAALDGGLRLHSTSGRPKIVFHPQGDTTGSNATFTICAPTSRQVASVVMSNAGRFQSSRGNADQGGQTDTTSCPSI